MLGLVLTTIYTYHRKLSGRKTAARRALKRERRLSPRAAGQRFQQESCQVHC